MRYIKVKVGEAKHGLELIAALLVFALAFAGTIWEVPPLSSTLDLGDSIKESLNEGMPAPPFNENTKSEAMPLSELAEELEIEVTELIAILEKAGHTVPNAEITIKEISDQAGLPPVEIFAPIKEAYPVQDED